MEGLNSPLIQDDGDGKSLKLRFDVSQYAPEEIVLKTVDNKLLVNTKYSSIYIESIPISYYNLNIGFIFLKTGSCKTRREIWHQVCLPWIQSWIFTSCRCESWAYPLQFIEGWCTHCRSATSSASSYWTTTGCYQAVNHLPTPNSNLKLKMHSIQSNRLSFLQFYVLFCKIILNTNEISFLQLLL